MSDAAKTIPVQAHSAANANWPRVHLHSIGDGRALARAVIEVLVRRALIEEGVIATNEPCASSSIPRDVSLE